MKKFGLCLLLMLAIGVCATASYSGKPLDTNPADVTGTYEGTISTFDPANPEVYKYLVNATLAIWGQRGSHFWGNLTVEGDWNPAIWSINGIILEDNTICYTTSNFFGGGPFAVYGKFIPATRTTPQRIETATLIDNASGTMTFGNNSHSSFTYTGAASAPIP